MLPRDLLLLGVVASDLYVAADIAGTIPLGAGGAVLLGVLGALSFVAALLPAQVSAALVFGTVGFGATAFDGRFRICALAIVAVLSLILNARRFRGLRDLR